MLTGAVAVRLYWALNPQESIKHQFWHLRQSSSDSLGLGWVQKWVLLVSAPDDSDAKSVNITF